MNLNNYQQKALETAVYPKRLMILYPVLALNGKAGEVAEKVKKVLCDDEMSESQRADIANELGDILWYVSACAHDLGYSLDDIAKMNLKKLSMRAKKGLLEGQAGNRVARKLEGLEEKQ